MVKELSTKIRENISKVIIGKEEVIDKVIVCLLCSGHILLEDMPGTGKTTLAKSLALSLNSTFKRVQFTPDLLPSELTGLRFFNQKENDFVFKKGLVFTNILLADEINRATPRTQSSLLECMEEKQVSDSGTTYQLSLPFIVIATQNPVETQGTFPLPEAQLDRFFMKLSIGYPEHDEMVDMLKRFDLNNPIDLLSPVVGSEDILEAQNEVRRVMVSDDIAGYIADICEKTRTDKDVKLGVSPRGALALYNASKGYACIHGRDYVIPDDVKAIASDVLSHRLILNGLACNRSDMKISIMERIISEVEVPTEKV